MKNPIRKVNVMEPPYFSNWADLFMPKIANRLLPIISQVDWITPNIVTLTSFILLALGSILLFLNLPFHHLIAAVLLPISYILDCLDGQLARTKEASSPLGDFLDKTLDVLKIYIITISLSYAVYQQTHVVASIFLGFTACFFFNFRYYIKLETMFSAINRDKNYLTKSRELRQELYEKRDLFYKELSTSFNGKLKIFWYKHRSIFAIDEAEFILLTAIGALFQRLEITLYILAISQPIITFWRFYERSKQTATLSERLYFPMRK